MILFGIAVAEVIMIICVWAMWGRGRMMAIFLIVLVLVVVGVSTMGLVESPAKYISLPNTPSQTIIIAATSEASTGFAALTLLEVILFFLILFKAVEYSRNRCSSFVLECFQHGLLYYVVLVSEHITGLSLITANVLLLVLSVTNLAIILTCSAHIPRDPVRADAAASATGPDARPQDCRAAAFDVLGTILKLWYSLAQCPLPRDIPKKIDNQICWHSSPMHVQCAYGSRTCRAWRVGQEELQAAIYQGLKLDNAAKGGTMVIYHPFAQSGPNVER
ncbi:hypothetical protein BD779DRAFT_1784865 [Infundibulicybe gibba]|nr:hypothetical protein BD779DRAFT_1784865 [Infundibulicybe gibba]